MYSLVSCVCNENESPFINIHSHGTAEFSVPLPSPPNGPNKLPFLVEYLHLVVGTVQNKDRSIFSNGHLAGLIEVSANIRDVFDADMVYHLCGIDPNRQEKNPAHGKPKQCCV